MITLYGNHAFLVPPTSFQYMNYPAGDVRVSLTQGEITDKIYQASITDCEAEDLIALNLWADLVHREGGYAHLLIPYFPGAREDRVTPGSPFGLKVYANLVNQAKCEKVFVVDPHSDVTAALVNNIEVVGLDRLLPYIFGKSDYITDETFDYVGVIAPDAGAGKRAWAVAQAFGVPLYQAGKHREPKTGKLSGFWCEPLPDGPLLIVDDICDGGGTFIGLADATHHDNLSLWVTHGVFTGDNVTLGKKFRRILTTDSFTTETPENATRFPLMKAMNHLWIW